MSTRMWSLYLRPVDQLFEFGPREVVRCRVVLCMLEKGDRELAQIVDAGTQGNLGARRGLLTDTCAAMFTGTPVDRPRVVVWPVESFLRFVVGHVNGLLSATSGCFFIFRESTNLFDDDVNADICLTGHVVKVVVEKAVLRRRNVDTVSCGASCSDHPTGAFQPGSGDLGSCPIGGNRRIPILRRNVDATASIDERYERLFESKPFTHAAQSLELLMKLTF